MFSKEKSDVSIHLNFCFAATFNSSLSSSILVTGSSFRVFNTSRGCFQLSFVVYTL
jgi:hypothetical protein